MILSLTRQHNNISLASMNCLFHTRHTSSHFGHRQVWILWLRTRPNSSLWSIFFFGFFEEWRVDTMKQQHREHARKESRDNLRKYKKRNVDVKNVCAVVAQSDFSFVFFILSPVYSLSSKVLFVFYIYYSLCYMFTSSLMLHSKCRHLIGMISAWIDKFSHIRKSLLLPSQRLLNWKQFFFV